MDVGAEADTNTGTDTAVPAPPIGFLQNHPYPLQRWASSLLSLRLGLDGINNPTSFSVGKTFRL
jgi:hypothetical protein